MPTLTLRTLGMSYLLEGLDGPEIDATALRSSLTDSYGPAIAPMSISSAPEKPLAALIVDRKAAPWPDLLDKIERLVRDQGFGYAAWTDDPLTPGSRATLHFHR